MSDSDIVEKPEVPKDKKPKNNKTNKPEKKQNGSTSKTKTTGSENHESKPDTLSESDIAEKSEVPKDKKPKNNKTNKPEKKESGSSSKTKTRESENDESKPDTMSGSDIIEKAEVPKDNSKNNLSDNKHKNDRAGKENESKTPTSTVANSAQTGLSDGKESNAVNGNLVTQPGNSNQKPPVKVGTENDVHKNDEKDEEKIDGENESSIDSSAKQDGANEIHSQEASSTATIAKGEPTADVQPEAKAPVTSPYTAQASKPKNKKPKKAAAKATSQGSLKPAGAVTTNLKPIKEKSKNRKKTTEEKHSHAEPAGASKKSKDEKTDKPPEASSENVETTKTELDTSSAKRPDVLNAPASELEGISSDPKKVKEAKRKLKQKLKDINLDSSNTQRPSAKAETLKISNSPDAAVKKSEHSKELANSTPGNKAKEVIPQAQNSASNNNSSSKGTVNNNSITPTNGSNNNSLKQTGSIESKTKGENAMDGDNSAVQAGGNNGMLPENNEKKDSNTDKERMIDEVDEHKFDETDEYKLDDVDEEKTDGKDEAKAETSISNTTAQAGTSDKSKKQSRDHLPPTAGVDSSKPPTNVQAKKNKKDEYTNNHKNKEKNDPKEISAVSQSEVKHYDHVTAQPGAGSSKTPAKDQEEKENSEDEHKNEEKLDGKDGPKTESKAGNSVAPPDANNKQSQKESSSVDDHAAAQAGAGSSKSPADVEVTENKQDKHENNEEKVDEHEDISEPKVGNSVAQAAATTPNKNLKKESNVIDEQITPQAGIQSSKSAAKEDRKDEHKSEEKVDEEHEEKTEPKVGNSVAQAEANIHNKKSQQENNAVNDQVTAQAGTGNSKSPAKAKKVGNDEHKNNENDDEKTDGEEKKEKSGSTSDSVGQEKAINKQTQKVVANHAAAQAAGSESLEKDEDQNDGENKAKTGPNVGNSVAQADAKSEKSQSIHVGNNVPTQAGLGNSKTSAKDQGTTVNEVDERKNDEIDEGKFDGEDEAKTGPNAGNSIASVDAKSDISQKDSGAADDHVAAQAGVVGSKSSTKTETNENKKDDHKNDKQDEDKVNGGEVKEKIGPKPGNSVAQTDSKNKQSQKQSSAVDNAAAAQAGVSGNMSSSKTVTKESKHERKNNEKDEKVDGEDEEKTGPMSENSIAQTEANHEKSLPEKSAGHYLPVQPGIASSKSSAKNNDKDVLKDEEKINENDEEKIADEDEANTGPNSGNSVALAEANNKKSQKENSVVDNHIAVQTGESDSKSPTTVETKNVVKDEHKNNEEKVGGGDKVKTVTNLDNSVAQIGTNNKKSEKEISAVHDHATPQAGVSDGKSPAKVKTEKHEHKNDEIDEEKVEEENESKTEANKENSVAQAGLGNGNSQKKNNAVNGNAPTQAGASAGKPPVKTGTSNPNIPVDSGDSNSETVAANTVSTPPKNTKNNLEETNIKNQVVGILNSSNSATNIENGSNKPTKNNHPDATLEGIPANAANGMEVGKFDKEGGALSELDAGTLNTVSDHSLAHLPEESKQNEHSSKPKKVVAETKTPTGHQHDASNSEKPKLQTMNSKELLNTHASAAHDSTSDEPFYLDAVSSQSKDKQVPGHKNPSNAESSVENSNPTNVKTKNPEKPVLLLETTADNNIASKGIAADKQPLPNSDTGERLLSNYGKPATVPFHADLHDDNDDVKATNTDVEQDVAKEDKGDTDWHDLNNWPIPVVMSGELGEETKESSSNKSTPVKFKVKSQKHEELVGPDQKPASHVDDHEINSEEKKTKLNPGNKQKSSSKNGEPKTKNSGKAANSKVKENNAGKNKAKTKNKAVKKEQTDKNVKQETETKVDKSAKKEQANNEKSHDENRVATASESKSQEKNEEKDEKDEHKNDEIDEAKSETTQADAIDGKTLKESNAVGGKVAAKAAASNSKSHTKDKHNDDEKKVGKNDELDEKKTDRQNGEKLEKHGDKKIDNSKPDTMSAGDLTEKSDDNKSSPSDNESSSQDENKLENSHATDSEANEKNSDEDSPQKGKNGSSADSESHPMTDDSVVKDKKPLSSPFKSKKRKKKQNVLTQPRSASAGNNEYEPDPKVIGHIKSIIFNGVTK